MHPFVLTHGDFHSTNILVEDTNITGVIDWECSGSYPADFSCDYPVWITDNPMTESDEEHSKKNKKLQEYWRTEMLVQDPEYIKLMDEMDEKKGSLYNDVCNNFWL